MRCRPTRHERVRAAARLREGPERVPARAQAAKPVRQRNRDVRGTEHRERYRRDGRGASPPRFRPWECVGSGDLPAG